MRTPAWIGIVACRLGTIVIGVDAARWSRRIVVNYPWCRGDLYHGVAHGPKVWSRGRLVAWRIVRQRLADDSPSVGWNLWIYTRRGAVVASFIWDRRPHRRHRLRVGA